MPVFNFMSIHFHTATASKKLQPAIFRFMLQQDVFFFFFFFIFYGVGSANIVYIYILSIGEEF